MNNCFVGSICRWKSLMNFYDPNAAVKNKATDLLDLEKSQLVGLQSVDTLRRENTKAGKTTVRCVDMSSFLHVAELMRLQLICRSA